MTATRRVSTAVLSDAASLRLELFVVADVFGVAHEVEADALAAFAARWKHPSGDARDVVGVGVFAVVNHGIDS
jgi:hypothetical protein